MNTAQLYEFINEEKGNSEQEIVKELWLLAKSIFYSRLSEL
jgi:hypothetical protein